MVVRFERQPRHKGIDLGGAHQAVVTANTGAAYQVNLAAARNFNLTLTANCTFTIVGAETAKLASFTMILRQDATGGRTRTWPASVKWPGGVAPTLSTAANAVDMLIFVSVDGGTTWLASLAGADYK